MARYVETWGKLETTSRRGQLPLGKLLRSRRNPRCLGINSAVQFLIGAPYQKNSRRLNASSSRVPQRANRRFKVWPRIRPGMSLLCKRCIRGIRVHRPTRISPFGRTSPRNPLGGVEVRGMSPLTAPICTLVKPSCTAQILVQQDQRVSISLPALTSILLTLEEEFQGMGVPLEFQGLNFTKCMAPPFVGGRVRFFQKNLELGNHNTRSLGPKCGTTRVPGRVGTDS